MSAFRAPVELGNALPLWNVPIGTTLHNVELRPGSGGQLARASGRTIYLTAREKAFAILRLPSREIRLVKINSWSTIGQVSLSMASTNTKNEKAGRIRWIGLRPLVRGIRMNPVDHPHGGGEGRCPVGIDRPRTPWGKPRLGVQTRRPRKYSDSWIVRRKMFLSVFLCVL